MDRSLYQIAAGVFFIHGVIFLLLMQSKEIESAPHPIKTIVRFSEKKGVQNEEKPAQRMLKQSQPKKASQSPKRSSQKLPASTHQKKRGSPSRDKSFKQQALKKAKESLSASREESIEPCSDSSSELPEMKSSASYEKSLIHCMRKMLQLPEHGDALVQLTLNRRGEVVEFQIVDSQSSANRLYLEQNIPRCRFSPFGSYFLHSESKTFALTLSSDMS